MKYKTNITARFYTFYLKKRVPACQPALISIESCSLSPCPFLSSGINQPISPILKSTMERNGNQWVLQISDSRMGYSRTLKSSERKTGNVKCDMKLIDSTLYAPYSRVLRNCHVIALCKIRRMTCRSVG